MTQNDGGMVHITKVSKASTTSDSLRTTIPLEIAKELGITIGSAIAWEIREIEGRRVAVIRRLE